MKDFENITDKPLAQKIWAIFGVFVILFSMIFMLPSIYLSIIGSNLMGEYINTYFIPFLFSLLLVFIILVVIYIWWHMAIQTDLTERLTRIEDKLDDYSKPPSIDSET